MGMQAARTSSSGARVQADTRRQSEKQRAAAISARVQELLDASPSSSPVESAQQQSLVEAAPAQPAAALKAKHPWTVKVIATPSLGICSVF